MERTEKYRGYEDNGEGRADIYEYNVCSSHDVVRAENTDFLSIGESSPVIPGNPGSCAPPLVATWKESVLCIARAHARTNACSRLWYGPFQRGPLNRNSQPERRPILFPSSITGDPPRADTNRAKIKDAPANVASRPATLDFRAKKARIASQGRRTRRRKEASFTECL